MKFKVITVEIIKSEKTRKTKVLMLKEEVDEY